MARKIVAAVFGLLFAAIPTPANAQCKDQPCSSLQDILDAAVIDFREYRRQSSPGPDVSTQSAHVPCQMSTWANNVPMYICYAQIPYGPAADWYAKTMDGLKNLNPSWQFKINSPGADHYVDAGPPNCEVPPTEGPYIGQCPLHLQVAKQSDGTAKIHLWMNSLSSPYLLKHVSVTASKAAPVTIVGGCDNLCQGLKKAFESRVDNFAGMRTAKSSEGTPATAVTLTGAARCLISTAQRSTSEGRGTQFVCYWRETSDSAAEARFRDLTTRFQVLAPSNWSTGQEGESEEFTGVPITVWHAIEPGAKHDVRIYVSGVSVGLHITAWE